MLRAAALVLGASFARAAFGIVVETVDRDGWFGSVGAVTTIGFTGFPPGTIIADEYAKLGILFTDGNDQVVCCFYPSFPQDGAGLHGNGPIHVAFSSPQRWIAVDGGYQRFQLFQDGAFVYESVELSSGFLGLLSTTPFDEAIIEDWLDPDGNTVIDDVHFGGLPVGDLDGDGTVGVPDLLALLAAWGPCPAHCPAICVGDLDGSEAVDVPDLLALLAAWGPNSGPADLDLDGDVGIIDLLTLLGSFGPCPVPFPPTCPPDLDGDCDVGVADLLAMLGNWG